MTRKRVLVRAFMHCRERHVVGLWAGLIYMGHFLVYRGEP